MKINISIVFVVFSVMHWGFPSLMEAQTPPWSFTRTSLSSVIAIPLEANPNIEGTPLSPGDYIGAFYDSLGTLACAGYVRWEGDENVGLTVYGDDVQLTPGTKEGFAANEPYKWKVWRASDGREFNMQITFDPQTFPGQRVFNNNTFAVLASMTNADADDLFAPWVVRPTSKVHEIDLPFDVGSNFEDEPLQPGDFIGVFYDSTATQQACAGLVRWFGVDSVLLAYGNTRLDSIKNGYDSLEVFKWRVWRVSDSTEVRAVATYNFEDYEQDSLFVDTGNSGLIELRKFIHPDSVGLRDQLELDKIVRFEDVHLSRSWRLISLPGADTTFNVDDLMVGQHSKIWTAFRFDGTVDFIQYSAQSRDNFFFRPGNGFLVLSSDVFVIRDTFVDRVELNPDSTYTIPLRYGWNLISNPYQYLIDWAKTRDFNRLRGNNSVIYQYIYGEYRRPQILEPYKAYFFFNVDDLPSIKLPHPGKYLPPSDFNFFKQDAPFLKMVVTDQVDQLKTPLELFAGSQEMAIPHPPVMNTAFRTGWVDPYQREKVLISSSIDTQIQENGLSSALLRVDLEQEASVSFNLDFDKAGFAAILKTANQYLIAKDGDDLEMTFKAGTHYVEVLIGSIEAIEQGAGQTPYSFELAQNYPNPFNPETMLQYSIPNASEVQLIVYDINGRRVQELVNRFQTAGTYQVGFNAQQLSSGVYFYRLTTSSGLQSTRKMTLIK